MMHPQNLDALRILKYNAPGDRLHSSVSADKRRNDGQIPRLKEVVHGQTA
jgi:hypothetical protein